MKAAGVLFTEMQQLKNQKQSQSKKSWDKFN